MNLRAAPLVACAFAALACSQAMGAPQARTPSSSSPAQLPCVEVRIGQDSAGRLDCLNRELRAEVDKTAPTVAGDPASGEPPSRLGQPTPAELKQRLGSAYGHSLVPQRPAQTFAPTLVPTH